MKEKCLCVLAGMLVFCLPCNAHRPGSEDMPVVYIVPTTHMDMDFIRTPSKSMDLYDDYIMEAVRVLEEDRSLRYSIQLGSAVEHFLANHTDMEARLAALIKNGQVEIGANWSNPHWSELPDELMAREVAGTKWWVHDRFGVWLTVADNGELADPTPQLAQVLASCEVPFFHSAKITQFSEKDYDGLTCVFRYMALDGTSVLWDSHFYNSCYAFWTQRRGNIWDWPAKKAGVEHALSDARTGNIGLYTAGGPAWDDALPDFQTLASFVRTWDANEENRKLGQFRLASYAEYFAALAAQPSIKNVPVWTGQTEHGELLYRWGWNKCRDRATFVNVMKDAEALASVCDMYGLEAYPGKQLDDLWLRMAYISTHNWGNRDRQTMEYPAIAAKALREAQQTRDHCAQLIANACGKDIAINTLCFERDAIGGLGWEARAEKSRSGERTPRTEISNRFFRITARPGVGLVSMYDKQNARELFAQQGNGSILRLRSSYEEGMGADRLTISRKVLSNEEGALANKIVEKYDAEFVCESVVGNANCLVLSGLTGTVKSEISVRLAADVVEISMRTLDKYTPDEIGADVPQNFAELLNEGPMFFASMEFNMPDAAEARVSVPFGSITIPMKMPRLSDGACFSSAAAGAQSWYAAYNERWHVPLQSIVGARAVTPYWLDVYDANSDFGITWVQNAPYANMFRDANEPNRFHKSLWRGVSDGGSYVWLFRTHKGNWQKAAPTRFAEEINRPVLFAGPPRAGDVTVPSQATLLEIEPENVVATCFKKAHDGRGYILRLCETADKAASVQIRTSGILADAAMEETNIVETAVRKQISGSPMTVSMRPFEIKTLRLIPAKGKDAD